MKYSHKLAFVVPTYNRPEDLRRMLKSLSEQSVKCDQCIIVDASDEPIQSVLEEFAEVNFTYARVIPPSLSDQRNAGMRLVRPEITLAGYLDDDIVLLEGALEAMFSFWQTAPKDVGGARFNIVDDYVSHVGWFKALFLIDSKKKGAVLKSGYHTDFGTIKEVQYAQWLSGGATIWRREVISEFDYDEWYEGHGFLEDLDYSYRVSKKYRLAVVANARVLHLTRPVRREKNYLLGQLQVINRIYFVRKHAELSVLLSLWALVGEFLVSLAMGVRKPENGRLERAWGNIVGFTKLVVGRTGRMGGIYK